MIVYDGLKTDFLSSCERDSIAMEIEENILSKMGRHTPMAEFRSWENSLNYMYKVLNDDEIPSDAGVAIEYNIPQTSKRVGFMISGYGKQDEPGMVIVELIYFLVPVFTTIFVIMMILLMLISIKNILKRHLFFQKDSLTDYVNL